MTHGESRPADGERDMTQTFSAGPTASFSVRPYKYSPIAAFSGINFNGINFEQIMGLSIIDNR